MNRSIKLLQLDEDIITKLKDHNICQVNHLINFHYEKEGFSQVETKMIVDAFDLYKQEELTKELRGRVNYFPLEYLDEKYSFGELGLSLRAFNGLTRNQITTVSQILKTIIHFEIYELDHLGAKSIAQIMTIVKDIVAREDLAKYLPIYASLHRFDDFTLTEIGFFEQMVKKLSALGFDTLGKLRFGYLNGTLGTLFNYKTMQSFTRKLAEYFSFTADDDFQFFQLYLVDNCFGKMSWTDILSIIGTKDPLYLEQLKKRLQGCCELLVNEEGVRLPYFREKIKNSSLKEETKAILEARFQGMTLQKIASLFHKTRERIRQIIRDRMAQIPLYLEKALVKEYNRFVWHPEVFKRVYAIDDFSFNVVKYLGERISFKEKYEYPQAYIQSLMDQGRIQAFSLAGFQEYFPKQFAPKMLIYGKTYDVMTKKQFLEFVIEHFIPKKGLHKSQIVHRANQVAAENHLDFAYDKFIDDVSNTILGLRYTRYYDYSLITPKVKEGLAKILNEVDGFYSCTYFYRKHYEFLKTIDIRDGYELHQLLRKIFQDDEAYQQRIAFNRQPMIGLVGMSFGDFIFQTWKTLTAPLPLDDFIDRLIENHGFHPGTLINIINQTLSDYICFHTLYNRKPLLTAATKQKMKAILVDEFYELEELKGILEKQGVQLQDYQYFSNLWLDEFGYKTHDVNYVIKKTYSSIKTLFFEKVLSHDEYVITPKDRQMRETTLILFIETLRFSYSMFLIDNERLISMKKLAKQGVSEQSLRNYVAALAEYLPHDEYFTYQSLVNEQYYLHHPAFQIVEDYHLHPDIIIGLIRNVKGIKKTTKGNLFKISSQPSIIGEFLKRLQKQHQFADVDQLQQFVKDHYGLVVKKTSFSTNK